MKRDELVSVRVNKELYEKFLLAIQGLDKNCEYKTFADFIESKMLEHFVFLDMRKYLNTHSRTEVMETD